MMQWHKVLIGLMLLLLVWPAAAQDQAADLPQFGTTVIEDIAAAYGPNFVGGEALAMALDPTDGTPIVAYNTFELDADDPEPLVQQRDGGSLQLAFCDALACPEPYIQTWLEDMDEDGNADNIGYDLAMAVDAATGNVVTVFRNQTTGAARMLLCLRPVLDVPPSGKCELFRSATLDAGDAANGIYAGVDAQVVLNSAGQAIVAYRRAAQPNSPEAATIDLLRCDLSLEAVTCERLQRIADVGNLRNFLSLALMPATEAPIISYSQNDGNRPPAIRLRLIVCNDADCSSATQHNLDGDNQTVVPPYRVGLFSDVAFTQWNPDDADIELMVAYRSLNNQDGERGLIITYCDEPPPFSACDIDAGGALTRVNPLPEREGAGVAPFILPPTGSAPLSMVMRDGDDLIWLLCGTPSCAADNRVLTLIGPETEVGQHSAPALIEQEGALLPLVAYFNRVLNRPQLLYPQ